MKILLWIIGVLLALFILGWMNAIRGTASRNRRIRKLIGPALTAVESRHEGASDVVWACAKNPATRNDLYAQLKMIGKADIFPDEFRAIEKIAESDLVRWLMHPNELRVAPTEIELLRQVEVSQDKRRGRIFLFRFRVEAPHWAARRGWMSGIAGPFWDGDSETDVGCRTFSELTAYDAMTDEDHVEFLKTAARTFGPIVPTLGLRMIPPNQALERTDSAE
jgi:hypothetical protein